MSEIIKINIVCVGKIRDKYINEGISEYAKRLSAYCNFCITEIAEERLHEPASTADIERALLKEGHEILDACAGSFPVAMCVEGRSLSSEAFAEKLNSWAVSGKSSVSFIIGSSHGLSDEVKAAAGYKLSMSEMTLPHTLARLFLSEQLYRAFSIINNGKYHK